MDNSQAATLIEYNSWANARILSKVSGMPQSDLFIQSVLSHKTIIDTLVHILDTQWYWREGAQTGILPTGKLLPSDFTDLSALKARWAIEDRLLLEFVQKSHSTSYKWLHDLPLVKGKAPYQTVVAYSHPYRQPRNPASKRARAAPGNTRKIPRRSGFHQILSESGLIISQCIVC